MPLWTGFCQPEAEINQTSSWPGLLPGWGWVVLDWNSGSCGLSCFRILRRLVGSGDGGGGRLFLSATACSQPCLDCPPSALEGPETQAGCAADRPPEASRCSRQARDATTLNCGKPLPTASTACPLLPSWTRRSSAATEVRVALGACLGRKSLWATSPGALGGGWGEGFQALPGLRLCLSLLPGSPRHPSPVLLFHSPPLWPWRCAGTVSFVQRALWSLRPKGMASACLDSWDFRRVPGGGRWRGD